MLIDPFSLHDDDDLEIPQEMADLDAYLDLCFEQESIAKLCWDYDHGRGFFAPDAAFSWHLRRLYPPGTFDDDGYDDDGIDIYLDPSQDDDGMC